MVASASAGDLAVVDGVLLGAQRLERLPAGGTDHPLDTLSFNCRPGQERVDRRGDVRFVGQSLADDLLGPLRRPA